MVRFWVAVFGKGESAKVGEVIGASGGGAVGGLVVDGDGLVGGAGEGDGKEGLGQN